MKASFKYIFLFGLTLLRFNDCYARLPQSLYQNFVIVRDKIYVLTNEGSLKIFNTGNGKLVDKYIPTANIKLICKDHTGNLVVVRNNDEISRLNNGGKWESVGSYHGNIFSIAFDSKNVCFLITNRGVYNCTTQEAHMPDNKFSHSEWSHFGEGNGWETNPSEYDDKMGGFMSSNDILWASSNHGEWGTDLYIFDTNSNVFIDYTKVAALPKFELNERVFGSIANPFSVEIATFTKNIGPNGVAFYEGRVCYEQDKDKTLKNANAFINNFYIGDCAYNKVDGLIYLITGKGLFTADPNKPLSKFSDLKAVAKFKLISYREKNINDGQRIPDYISKIEFAPNGNLVMLAPGNGIRLFNGKETIIAE